LNRISVSAAGARRIASNQPNVVNAVRHRQLPTRAGAGPRADIGVVALVRRIRRVPIHRAGRAGRTPTIGKTVSLFRVDLPGVRQITGWHWGRRGLEINPGAVENWRGRGDRTRVGRIPRGVRGAHAVVISGPGEKSGAQERSRVGGE